MTTNTRSSGGIIGSAGIAGAAGNDLPPEYDPQAADKAAAKLRGQIFGVGLSIAWALVFLVLGTCLFFGVEMLTAIWITIISFAVVIMLSFGAEIVIEPSLEDVARQREEERIKRAREEAPSAGGVMAARLALTGGADDTHPNVLHTRPAGVVGAAPVQKGRRLDVTLPEEHSAPPPQTASGAVGGPRRPDAQAAPEEGFQDLASLLKEAAQPSPVPVRQR